jgi:hypothetical protein
MASSKPFFIVCVDLMRALMEVRLGESVLVVLAWSGQKFSMQMLAF